jgi:GNAT superfamily N-acetyltransferase
VDFDAGLLERVAQLFRRDMWESVVEEAVIESGIEAESFGPVQASAFGELPEFTTLNQIQGAAEPDAISGGYLAEAIDWMRSREVDYRVFVADGRPETRTAEAWLNSRGYERGDGWVTFVRDAAPPTVPRNPYVKLWALGEQEIDGEGLSAIVSQSMDLPLTAETLFFALPHHERWRCYTASLIPDEQVVATASMLIHEGVAQLGPGNTLEHARGRGCNTELLRRRLADAHDAGCHTIFAEVWDCRPDRYSTAGRNLVRAGFEPAYAVRNWQRPALQPATTQRFRGTST